MYVPVPFSDSISQSRRTKIRNKLPLMYTKADMKGSGVLMVHASRKNKFDDAIKKGKGFKMSPLSDDEIEATIKSELTGTGILDWLKKAYKVIKPVIKPAAKFIATSTLDALESKGIEKAPQLTPLIASTRKLIKDKLGVGLEQEELKKNILARRKLSDKANRLNAKGLSAKGLSAKRP